MKKTGHEIDISIIIPCYNADKYIDRCLLSITECMCSNFIMEIICIDDSSTDSTLSCLRRWEKKYPGTIVVIVLSENVGGGRARNIGMSYSHGTWIAFVDADDWLERDYFSVLYSIAMDRDSDMVICGAAEDVSQTYVLWDNRSDNCIRDEIKELIISEESRRDIIVNNVLHCLIWGRLIKKSIIEDNKIAFPESVRGGEDTYFSSLINLYVRNVSVLDAKMYHYFVNQDSVVHGKRSSIKLDGIDAMLMLWNEYKKRGVLDTYGRELEYDFIYHCYISTIYELAFRYENPDYSVFLLLKGIATLQMPDYKDNPYLDRMTEMQKLIVSALFLPVKEEEFASLIDSIRKAGWI